MNEPKELFSIFKSIFESGEDYSIRHFRAPARINIIGEHVDYLGGFVLPAAINFYINVIIQSNNLDTFKLYSHDFKELTEIKRPFQQSKDFPWVDYVQGVVNEIGKKGYQVPGFNMLIQGNIPQGAGLSSSASLEVAVGYAISSYFNLNLRREEIALIGQAAENNFVGTKCGIMDQFIIATGKKDYCISLNTNTLEYDYHKFDLSDHEFYLIDSNVKHSLKDSEYNQRRKECETALSKIKKFHPEIENLYHFDKPITEDYQFSLEEKRRIMHVTGERVRTEKVIRYLEDGQLSKVGTLLYECHWSLSKLFEVSCPETDFLVESLQTFGAKGARMIGGGFGGCILVLDLKANFSHIQEVLEKNYEQKFLHGVSFYKFTISDGVKEI